MRVGEKLCKPWRLWAVLLAVLSVGLFVTYGCSGSSGRSKVLPGENPFEQITYVQEEKKDNGTLKFRMEVTLCFRPHSHKFPSFSTRKGTAEAVFKEIVAGYVGESPEDVKKMGAAGVFNHSTDSKVRDTLEAKMRTALAEQGYRLAYLEILSVSHVMTFEEK